MYLGYQGACDFGPSFNFKNLFKYILHVISVAVLQLFLLEIAGFVVKSNFAITLFIFTVNAHGMSVHYRDISCIALLHTCLPVPT
jgi:hypothetical protein